MKKLLSSNQILTVILIFVSCSRGKSEENIDNIRKGQDLNSVLSIMGDPDESQINIMDSSELIYYYSSSIFAAGRIEIHFDTLNMRVQNIRDHDSW